MRVSGERAPAGPCLDAESLAAWSDGSLSSREREAAEAHAADCDRCLTMLATLTRTLPAQADQSWWSRWLSVRWVVPLTAATAAVALWVAVPSDAPRSLPNPGSPPTALGRTADSARQPAEAAQRADVARQPAENRRDQLAREYPLASPEPKQAPEPRDETDRRRVLDQAQAAPPNAVEKRLERFDAKAADMQAARTVPSTAAPAPRPLRRRPLAEPPPRRPPLRRHPLRSRPVRPRLLCRALSPKCASRARQARQVSLWRLPRPTPRSGGASPAPLCSAPPTAGRFGRHKPPAAHCCWPDPLLRRTSAGWWDRTEPCCCQRTAGHGGRFLRQRSRISFACQPRTGRGRP